MRILAIETSCDETAISLIETESQGRTLTGSEGPTFRILAHEVSSQIDMHREWGGVVPMLAKREHRKILPVLLDKIFEANKLTSQEAKKLDLIAVTYGPGLEPALWEGINFAKDLATKWQKPIVAVDHMHGHIVSALLKSISDEQFAICKPELPAITLLISGGHTQLVLMSDINKFEIIGNTRDDAVGEAFDKVARILGLPYPGGPEIAKLASRYSEIQKFRHVEISKSPNIEMLLPRPMLHSGNLDFSFSGLKTAVLYLVKKLGQPDEEQRIAIAHEFEQAVTEVLAKKTLAAMEKHKAKSLLVGGGVIANKTIRERFVVESQGRTLGTLKGSTFKLFLPDPRFTGDNASMIGVAGLLRLGFAGQGYLYPEHLLESGTPEFESLGAQGNLALYK